MWSKFEVQELSGSRLASIENTLAQHHSLIVDYSREKTVIIAQHTDLKTCGTTHSAKLKAMREEMLKMCAR
ncbi:hypothetical protein AMTR_s00031p00056300 [Amborella trichopoda]|uniref:Uncharacterized protein n=1 Tax=Amborella trichopoda TaxID=13333 RepID=U5D507_AMBTC|nr:hypothetical protein AMTR_s00031p00056300 [Amborella trichopoda]